MKRSFGGTIYIFSYSLVRNSIPINTSNTKGNRDVDLAKACLSYINDGDTIFYSVCGLLSFNNIDKNLLKDCTHLHVMGFSLYSFRAIDAMRKAIGIIKNKGGTISFDPNLRKEIFSIQEMEQSFGYIMEYTDIFLLSEKEVRYFN